MPLIPGSDRALLIASPPSTLTFVVRQNTTNLKTIVQRTTKHSLHKKMNILTTVH